MEPTRSARRKGKLTGEVGQWLDRRADALVNLRTRLGGETGAVLDRRQGGVGLQLAGAQKVCRSVQTSAELDHGIAHPV
jgi:hypothetical protein